MSNPNDYDREEFTPEIKPARRPSEYGRWMACGPPVVGRWSTRQTIQSEALARQLREQRIDRCVRLAFGALYGCGWLAMMRASDKQGLVSVETRRVRYHWRNGA